MVETVMKDVVDEEGGYHNRVKLRKYTLQEKEEMVQTMNNGVTTCGIMHKLNFLESTVWSLSKNKKVFSRFSSAHKLADTSWCNRLLAIMEHCLNE